MTVYVTDNGDGTLSAQVDYGEPGKIVFHNQMTCKFIPTATKVLQGGELAQDQFTFELRNAEQGGDVISTAKNDAAGNIAFEPITYGASDVGKTFEYWISEVDDGQKGIAYDTKTVHVLSLIHISRAPRPGSGTRAWRICAPIPSGSSSAGSTETLKCPFPLRRSSPVSYTHLLRHVPRHAPRALRHAPGGRHAALGHGRGPVSYTHLDVYKRQGLARGTA